LTSMVLVWLLCDQLGAAIDAFGKGAVLPAPNDGGAEDSAVPQVVLGIAESENVRSHRCGRLTPAETSDRWAGHRC
jgi:hypothetical protein